MNKFQEGCMWEDGWRIENNSKCSEFGGGQPCKHCHSIERIVHIRRGGDSQYIEGTWICPRVAIAFNEGGNNSTGICIDCILEAVENG